MKTVAVEQWLRSLGYFDLETTVLEALENLFGPKVLPMSPERSVTHISGTDNMGIGGPNHARLNLAVRLRNFLLRFLER